MHEDLIRTVAQKTGLPEDKARSATETVIGYLKEKSSSNRPGRASRSTGAPTRARACRSRWRLRQRGCTSTRTYSRR